MKSNESLNISQKKKKKKKQSPLFFPKITRTKKTLHISNN